MVQFNFSERTIKAKVVYYGPAQSGKTTNLEQIHRLTDPSGTNSLISLNTGQDRTLFFDLLPFSLGTVSGYDFKVQLYTVPGQVQYNATRRVVLAGADAVVFVADSRRSLAKDNVAALENMKVNLLANRLVPEKVPLVLQYNKRDLGELLEVEELNKQLNPWGRRSFGAVATRGEGVLDTFVAIVQEMLAAIAVKYNLKEKGLDPESVPGVVQQAFDALMGKLSATPPAPSAPRIVLSQAPAASAAPAQAAAEAGLVSEELLNRALRSNVELAEALSSLVHDVNEGLGALLSQSSFEGVQREAQRLRQLVQSATGRTPHGVAGGPPPAVAPVAPAPVVPPPRPPGAPPAAAASATPSVVISASDSMLAASVPAARAATPPAPPPRPVAASPAEELLRQGLAAVQAMLDARGIVVELQVSPGLPRPRAAAETVARAVSRLVEAAADLGPATPAVLRCERKPVLLRGRDGSEVRRDFLMLAIAHSDDLGAADQQQVVQGALAGPYGEAARLVRETGGFVRFAPLPGNRLEARLFVPL